jgi:hypothetical protein
MVAPAVIARKRSGQHLKGAARWADCRVLGARGRRALSAWTTLAGQE